MTRTARRDALDGRAAPRERKAAGRLASPLRKAFDKKSTLGYSFLLV
jgi:hypothetical protein